MRPLSRLIGGRSSSIPVHQGTDGGTLPTASTSGRTSCSFADSLTSSTDLPTNATEVPAFSLEHETEDFIDDLKQGHPNILVTVRVRPVQPRELQNGSKDVVRVLDNKVVLLLDPGLCSHDDVLRVKRTREKRYAFDYVFDATKDQQCVYANTTEFLVDGVLRGFNATAFAYGATGAGKTYTMIGSYEKPGVMVRTLKDLFVKVDQQSADNEYNIRCSFLEIYNEAVRDLLDARNEHCEVREDPTRGMAISNVCEVAVKTADEILELLQKGNKRRIQEPTDANQTSSRSHAVLQVVVTQKSKTPGVTAELAVGKLSMVDLAGSERASQNNNRGMRMVEGASINRSLLALGNVINALCDRSKTAKNIFVPYRDSKLTRLLKDSLGGSCRTVMIANISPAHTQFEDTNNTLKYANRAKNIKTISKRNVLTVNYHIEKYTHVIEQLQAEVGTLRAMLASGTQATVLQDPAASASTSRVAGIVKTLQERQRLRQALVRLDEQLHQLEQHSPLNSDGAPSSLTCQAGSLQKAKEDLVTRLRINAAECEELQHKLLLTPDSPALLHALLKNMEALLEQNYELQQTNEELNETILQNCRSQRNIFNEPVLEQRLRLPAELSVEAAPQKSTHSSELDSSDQLHCRDGSCCADGQMQKRGSQAKRTACLDQNLATAVPAAGLGGRRQSSRSIVASSRMYASRECPASAADIVKHSYSAVDGHLSHHKVSRMAPPASLPTISHTGGRVTRCVRLRRSEICTSSHESGDGGHIVSCNRRGRSPTALYTNDRSPPTSTMHVSREVSPGRVSTISPLSQECPFYTPRSQPMALAPWAAACSRSVTSGVPITASCISEISVALASLEGDTPKSGTSSSFQPTGSRQFSPTPPADSPGHLLTSRIASSADREQNKTVLQTASSEWPEHPAQNAADQPATCYTAPLPFQQRFSSLPGAVSAEYGAFSAALHADSREALQHRKKFAENVSEGEFTLQPVSSRSFSEEADVPDEFGTDNVEKSAEAKVFSDRTGASNPAAQEQRRSPVRRSGGPLGATSRSTGKHTPADLPTDLSDPVHRSQATHAAAPELAAQKHVDVRSSVTCGGIEPADAVQKMLSEAGIRTRVEGGGLGARARAHFGFRRAGATDDERA